jgi:hypothetical protein
MAAVFRLDAAGQLEVVLEAADVVALPAGQRAGDRSQDLQGRVAIDALEVFRSGSRRHPRRAAPAALGLAI